MRKQALIPLLVLVALLGMAPNASAGRAEYLKLSRDLAAPWPGLQRSDGTFPDWLREDRTSRYGDAVLGLGLIHAGVRDRNRALVRSGMRAIDATTRTVDRWFATRVFEHWAVATAYNVVREKLRHWRSANRARRRWARYIRRQYLNYIHMDGYQNKTLVDAVAILEAQRTGIRSRDRRSVVGGYRRRARRLAVNTINKRVPDLSRGVKGYVLSDPPNNPIAYHGFSYAMYARAVRLLRKRASWRARRVLRQVGNTSRKLTAPDGSLAYWGRSQEQKWTLSSTAYGAAVTAREKGSTRRSDRRLYALADRVLDRLRGYGVGPHGEWIIPAIRQSYPRGIRATDSYARATEYTGLALIYLNWAIPFLPKNPSPGTIPADVDGFDAIFSPGPGRFATVRRGDLWYAVRLRGGGGYRYDFGPAAVKRLVGGVWRDVIPYRPNEFGSGGPVLRFNGRSAVPIGEAVRVLNDGTVSMVGGFEDNGWVRRNVRYRVRPAGCGVSVEVDGHANDTFAYSVFFRGDVTPTVGERTVEASGQQALFNVPIRSARTDRDVVSVSDAFLTREEITVRAPGNGTVTLRLC